MSAAVNRFAAGLTRYVQSGIPPGSFLRAVLANDLEDALACADSESMANLQAIVEFVAESVPPRARGSEQAVREWIKEGGAAGEAARNDHFRRRGYDYDDHPDACGRAA